jgi:hypothetical protein
MKREWIANKIAKDQFIIPYTNLVETLIENKIRTRAGFKEVSWNKINHRLYKDISEYNLSTKTKNQRYTTLWLVPLGMLDMICIDKPLDKYTIWNVRGNE